MLVKFFFLLRSAGVPVSITELLTLLEALQRGLGEASAERFYSSGAHLPGQGRALLRPVRPRVRRAFQGRRGRVRTRWSRELPADWLEKMAERRFTDEEKAADRGAGRLGQTDGDAEEAPRGAKGRHQGGNKWIGTAGTSPFGAYGYNPEGVRIGQDKSRNRSAVKVWDRREFANLDDTVELGTRNMKLALRRLRRFARRGAPTELALADTIDATARSGGWLDIKMVPERHNVVKVLLLLDVGGSMDDHVKTCEELFSAARSEFKHLEHFYFHNFPYEALWRDNRRRFNEHIGTVELMRTYASRLQAHPGGRCDHEPIRESLTRAAASSIGMPEPGERVAERLMKAYPKFAWINPQPQARWRHTASIALIRELLEGRMYPLTLSGLDDAIDALDVTHAR